jgi:hypothetical protein
MARLVLTALLALNIAFASMVQASISTSGDWKHGYAIAAGNQFLISSINLDIAGDTAGATAQETTGRVLGRAADELGNRTYAVLGGAGFEGASLGERGRS